MGRRHEPGPSRAGTPGRRSVDLFAEAFPERVVVEEEYRYSQEISANRWTRQETDPSGHIDIRVPYDGVHHLPSGTVKALARRLRAAPDESEATIGHVVLTDHTHTDLADLALDRGHGAIPLRIPVRARSLPDAAALAADRREYRWALDYSPAADHPELVPLELKAKIEDSDTSGLRDIMSELAGGPAKREFVSAMARYIAFRPALTLVLTAAVVVTLPRHRQMREPKVRRVSVEMPAMSSLGGRKLRLTVDGREHPLQYDAERGCVEWFDVPTQRSAPSDDTSAAASDQVVRHMFTTKEMRLDIDQPGDLFDREEVVIRAEVELPGLLLSGTQARLFDACGRWSRGRQAAATPTRRKPVPRRAPGPAFTGKPRTGREPFPDPAEDRGRTAARRPDPVTQRTVVHTRCAVTLHDAFAQRAFRPHQSLHFDEIIPAQERVADVEAVLTSLGFTTTETDLQETPDGSDPEELLWLVQGERGHQVSGANAAEIWVVIRGRRRSTRRQSERGAGTKYTTLVPTGELELFVRGTTLGNPDTLMEQMNALHRILKDRFRPMRSQR